MDWRVNFDDVQLMSKGNNAVSQQMQSMQFHSMQSLGTGGNYSLATRLNSHGTYKGESVTLTRLGSDAIDLTNALRADIRAVREIHHKNMLHFVGACIDKGNPSLLNEFTQKGCLEDCLANEDIHLDWNFKFSILKDIASGMQYLHTSSFGSHGALCSGNCFIDNRWTVKIANFGLRSLRALAENHEEGNGGGYETLRWTAPELLPSRTHVHQVGRGTPKGDVYSFAVLMAEVASRIQPFDDHEASVKSIIESVGGAAGAGAKFPPVKKAWQAPEDLIGVSVLDVVRPTIPNDAPPGYAALAAKCWADDAGARPTFKEVIKSLSLLNPQRGEMVDNLIKMLEK